MTANYPAGSMAVKRRLEEHRANAEAAERQADLKHARELWLDVARDYRQLAKFEYNQLEVTRLIKKAKACDHRAGKLKEGSQNAPVEAGADTTTDAWRFKSNVTFDDIAGMASVKRSLKCALGLQLARLPDGVSLMELPTRIFLHGRPGCGKTLLAGACASTLGAVFFNVKIPDLLSKYVGESSKIIRSLYRRARDIADEGLAVVFIDEVDGLIVNRDTAHANYETQVLNTFLAELDGLAEKNTRANVITIVATNKPESLDEAFMSRMDLRFAIDLPDAKARTSIFKTHIEKRGFKLDDRSISFDELSECTEGQSGRDIQSICKSVLLNVLDEENLEIPELVDNGKIKDHVLNLRAFTKTDFTRVVNGK